MSFTSEFVARNYLTLQIFRVAIESVVRATMRGHDTMCMVPPELMDEEDEEVHSAGDIEPKLNGHQCYIVVLVPNVIHYKSGISHQQNVGHASTELLPVALEAAYRLLDQPDNSEIPEGIRREGIIVVCVGLQSYFNKMLAEMIVSMAIALACDEFEKEAARLSRKAS